MANKSSNSAKDLSNTLGLDEINEFLKNKKKLWWLNFQTGFVRGFSSVLGAAIAIVLIGFVVSLFGGLPYIGNFIQKIGEAIQAK